MPNTIELRKQYSTMLDEVYKLASLTSVLDGANELVRDGANANEILIPKMDMSGLADYSRTNGYATGDVTLEYETKKCTYDRGRMFAVDALDNIETAGIAFGRLSGEFLRTKVVPELDAYRMSQYAALAGTSTTGNLSTAKAAIEALRAAKTTIEDSEANIGTCVLFISPAIYGMIEDADTTTSRRVLEDWAGVVKVPAARFTKAVELGADGYTPNPSNAINFLIVDKAAAIQFQKHTVSKIISPEQNQDSDAWKFAYRTVGIAEVLDNKKDGIYVNSIA